MCFTSSLPFFSKLCAFWVPTNSDCSFRLLLYLHTSKLCICYVQQFSHLTICKHELIEMREKLRLHVFVLWFAQNSGHTKCMLIYSPVSGCDEVSEEFWQKFASSRSSKTSLFVTIIQWIRINFMSFICLHYVWCCSIKKTRLMKNYSILFKLQIGWNLFLNGARRVWFACNCAFQNMMTKYFTETFLASSSRQQQMVKPLQRH